MALTEGQRSTQCKLAGLGGFARAWDDWRWIELSAKDTGHGMNTALSAEFRIDDIDVNDETITAHLVAQWWASPSLRNSQPASISAG